MRPLAILLYAPKADHSAHEIAAVVIDGKGVDELEFAGLEGTGTDTVMELCLNSARVSMLGERLGPVGHSFDQGDAIGQLHLPAESDMKRCAEITRATAERLLGAGHVRVDRIWTSKGDDTTAREQAYIDGLVAMPTATTPRRRAKP